MEQARTVGELKRAGYEVAPVREEMRRNLLTKLASGERILNGIIGYDDSVVPEIENAILAGHHIVFLGERGQGKSRIMRACSPPRSGRPASRAADHDDPFAPVSAFGKTQLAELGERAPIRWVHRDERYGEKLATPDVSIADLIGEIDPVKVAEGRYLADEETIHYGLVPRTNRGIFAINELPDLTEKVQVGLFNLMEEKDVQIKGYKVRLPLDVVIVASANPEDYTSRVASSAAERPLCRASAHPLPGDANQAGRGAAGGEAARGRRHRPARAALRAGTRAELALQARKTPT
jgi:magnesium chelatase subunit I